MVISWVPTCFWAIFIEKRSVNSLEARRRHDQRLPQVRRRRLRASKASVLFQKRLHSFKFDLLTHRIYIIYHISQCIRENGWVRCCGRFDPIARPSARQLCPGLERAKGTCARLQHRFFEALPQARAAKDMEKEPRSLYIPESITYFDRILMYPRLSYLSSRALRLHMEATQMENLRMYRSTTSFF